MPRDVSMVILNPVKLTVKSTITLSHQNSSGYQHMSREGGRKTPLQDLEIYARDIFDLIKLKLKGSGQGADP